MVEIEPTNQGVTVAETPVVNDGQSLDESRLSLGSLEVKNEEPALPVKSAAKSGCGRCG